MNNLDQPIPTEKPAASAKNAQHSALTVAISSGKGGVGKTNITTNLGIALAKAGKKVCVFDADTSLANINILLGQTPEYTLEHFLREQMPIQNVIIEGPSGLKIVPSATGITDFVLLNKEQQSRLLNALEQLEQEFDYILIDTAAGIGDSVIRFIQSAQYSVVVISPEPTSLTDAFSLIKVLKKRDHKQPVYILVNMANNYAHSMEVFKRFAHAVNKYIEIKVRYLGYLPTDSALRNAVAKQNPVFVSAPESPAARCIGLLANILLKHFSKSNAPVRKISQFWKAQLEKQADLIDASSLSSDESKSRLGSSPSNTATKQETSSIPEAQTEPSKDFQSQTQNQNLTQEQADTMLADLLQHYLGEFGELPSQAIDLVLQAHAQGELPDAQMEAIQQTGAIETKDQQTTTEESTLLSQSEKYSSIEQIHTHIDELISDAEKTKQQLTDLANYVTERYRSLYNQSIHNPAVTQSKSGLARKVSKNQAAVKIEEDTQALLQSIQFASALDKNE